MAINPNQIGGVLGFTIDGVSYDVSDSDPTVRGGASARETVPSLTGGAGFTETPAAPSLEVELLVKPGINVDTLADKRAAVVQIDYPSGETVVLRDAWQTAEATVSGGKVTLKFECAPSDFARLGI